MYRISNIVIAAAVMIITASCVKTEEPASGSGISDGGGTIEGDRVEMTFQLTTSDMSRPTVSIPLESADNSSSMTVTMDDPITRAETDSEAAGTDDENKITGLWVLQFSGTDGASTLVSREYYPSTAFVGNKVAVSFIESKGDIRAYFVANVGADHFSDLTIGSGGTTLSAFEAMVCNFNPSATVPANGLPMVGSYDGLPSAMGGIVTLKRMVSKINFTCIVDPTSEAESFTVREVRLVSAAAGSAIVAPSVPTGTTGLYPDPWDRNNFVNGKKITVENGSLEGEENPYKYTWYVAENLQGIITNESNSDSNKGGNKVPLRSTYIEITGDYTKPGETLMVSYCIYPGRNSYNNFNIERNYLYSITSTIKGMDENDTRVVIGEDLSVNGTANCYMVHEAGKRYRFDATTMGNGKETAEFVNGSYRADAIIPERLEPDDVKVLWETGEKGNVIEQGSVMIRGDEVFFTTAGDVGADITEGNAVIGVFKGGKVIWSWHIWSTKYDPDKDFVTITNYQKKNYDMMRYNLGATIRAGYNANEAYNFVPESYGLLYQWGRKDPFIGPADATGTTVAITANDSAHTWDFRNITANTSGGSSDPITYTIQNPTDFIKGISLIFDWVSATDNNKRRDNLWGNPNDGDVPNDQFGKKSIYDPCPVGWRVPPQDIWTGFTTTGKDERVYSANIKSPNIHSDYGYSFHIGGSKTGPTTFFPAVGSIVAGSGLHYYASKYGYCWSSSPYSIGSYYAGCLHFDSDYVKPLNQMQRSYGLSVRCIKEMEENEDATE